MRTLAVYCYSSTAVQLAVHFCCCLCTLLWRLGSYKSPKLSSYSHIKPFLRYLWSKGRLSEPSGKGLSVDPPTDHRNHFFLFFFNPFFLPDLSFFFISCFLLPSLHSLSLLFYTTPTHQILETCPPYAPLPSCTSVLLVARCLPPRNPSLQSNKPFFFLPLGTPTDRWKPLEVSFAPGFFVQVPPHYHYTHELQLP